MGLKRSRRHAVRPSLRPTLRRRSQAIFFLPWALFLVACQPGTDSESGSGVLNVLIADAPTDDFSAVNVTLTEIKLIGGAAGPVQVFEGRETFDLLALRTVSELFAIDDEVPTGRYNQIQLQIAEEGIELVEEQTEGPTQFHYPSLPRDGVLNIALRPALKIRDGESHGIEIDIDLAHSIIPNADGSYRFRPVVGVLPIREVIDGRLVRLSGRMTAIDLDNQRFSLCRISRPLAWLPEKQSHGPHPDSADHRLKVSMEDFTQTAQEIAQRKSVGPRHPWRRCVEVVLSEEASLSDQDGNPLQLEEVEDKSPVVAIGRVRPTRGRPLAMLSTFVGIGEPGAFQTRRGRVLSDLSLDDDFVLDLASDRGDLIIQLSETTQLFERGGWPISREAIIPGTRASVTGVIFFSSESPAVVQAGLLILDLDEEVDDSIQGEITSIDREPQGVNCPLQINVDGLQTGVSLQNRAKIYQVNSESGTSKISELSEILPGTRAEIYGQYGDLTDPCYRAAFVVVSPRP